MLVQSKHYFCVFIILHFVTLVYWYYSETPLGINLTSRKQWSCKSGELKIKKKSKQIVNKSHIFGSPSRVVALRGLTKYCNYILSRCTHIVTYWGLCLSHIVYCWGQIFPVYNAVRPLFYYPDTVHTCLSRAVLWPRLYHQGDLYRMADAGDKGHNWGLHPYTGSVCTHLEKNNQTLLE